MADETKHTADMVSLSDTCEWDSIKRPAGSTFTIEAPNADTLEQYRDLLGRLGYARSADEPAPPPPAEEPPAPAKKNRR